MKRIAHLFVLLAALGAADARAASYESGLQMVRNGNWLKAISEFSELAQAGDPKSQFSLALIYHLGRGVKVDLETAYGWYKKSALQYHAPAVNNIGMMYLNGEYVAQNREVAFKLFLMASEEHAQAHDNLGKCYENGWGTSQNIPQAIKSYELAGQGGYILGYMHLAELYEEGRGVSKDMEKAVEAYIKAAEKNNKRARMKLVGMGRLPEELKK